MASEGDAKVRRIAIVLQSMDAATVRKLLAQFPEESARAVRRALTNLGTVSPVERAAAVQELQVLLGKPAVMTGSDNPAAQFLKQRQPIEDAIQWSPEVARRGTSHGETLPGDRSPTISQGTAAAIPAEHAPPDSGRSWQDVAPASLAQVLESERPTVIAAILHEMPVVMATSVLQLLPIPKAAETMAVMPQLHRNDPAVLNDLLDQVRAKMDEAVRNEQKTLQGIEKLKAIIAHAPQDQKYLWATSLNRVDPNLPSLLEWGQSIPNTEVIDRAAVAPKAPPEQLSLAPPDISPTQVDRELEESTATLAIDAYRSTKPFLTLGGLLQLADADFVAVLHSVEPNTVLLALAGAEKSILKRVEQLVPRRDITRLRQRIHDLNGVSLQKIDQARNAILEAANNLYADGRSTSRVFPPLSAAA